MELYCLSDDKSSNESQPEIGFVPSSFPKLLAKVNFGSRGFFPVPSLNRIIVMDNGFASSRKYGLCISSTELLDLVIVAQILKARATFAFVEGNLVRHPHKLELLVETTFGVLRTLDPNHSIQAIVSQTLRGCPSAGALIGA